MTSPVEVPDRLVRTAVRWCGEEAARPWLAALPEVASEYLDRWGLTHERTVLPGGALSLTLLVRRADGTPATLKLGFVDRYTAHEAEALTMWAGHGAVRLLDADVPRGALLLERLQPDVSLRSLPEDRAMLEAVEVLRHLWIAPPDDCGIDLVADRAEVWTRSIPRRHAALGGPCPKALVDEAVSLCSGLAASQPSAVVLHADCHHGNILAAERAKWLAIDPRPMLGEPAFDLGALVRDRLTTVVAETRPQAVVRRRVTWLADSLDLDAERVRGWALVQALALGLWCVSAGDPAGEDLLSVAEWLA
ncbi:aminoglycoside phosphotransferase family protein [Yinghuangia sp. ASG 101]|uniref:aminoglycoside phosphotransferase family protein n=1 Tax=Yinghuangia sp. ASG 101 TaxID=2896848 RepID=UPI001E5467DD|nr:aminoglycoside phosphotransferase family protein [Yinghuangia sp. ASG 101]UGQ09891.1 aminoglycoside phosphotransferase family protein [Yinghuangia sp. ASG 101]